jgi:hypothetical protein
VERSSGSGTRLWVDGGGGSDVRPGDGMSKQVCSALAPATRVLKGGGGGRQRRKWEALHEGAAPGGIRQLTAGGRRAQRLAWLTEVVQQRTFG